MKKEIFIVKSGGERELFNRDKIFNSLHKAGADTETAEKIVSHIDNEIKDGMSTHEIYSHAFYLLHKSQKPLALKYSLRRSLLGFGPSGFPFEKFIAEIWKQKGYTVETDKIVKGHCAEHEVDVIAWNENKLIMIEAKFHNQSGVKSDLKVALYVKARYEDLEGAMFNYGKMKKLSEGWLITNTKFTSSAIEYAQCQGLRLVGWNYPMKGNLQDLIEDSGLHPITCLTTLTVAEKKDLIERGLVSCNSLITDNKTLEEVGIKGEHLEQVIEEVKSLCQNSTN
ncbi:MAG: restriction endonuclease [Patescibacteria group bacterium]|nr:restriction endonuclease [Patescibacteria group bacterium]